MTSGCAGAPGGGPGAGARWPPTPPREEIAANAGRTPSRSARRCTALGGGHELTIRMLDHVLDHVVAARRSLCAAAVALPA